MAAAMVQQSEESTEPQLALVVSDTKPETSEQPTSKRFTAGDRFVDATFVEFRDGNKPGRGHGIFSLYSGEEVRVSESVLSRNVGEDQEIQPGDHIQVRIGVVGLRFSD